jgi:hypothetical protein
VLRLRQLRRHVQCDQNGASNLCDLLAHLRVQQVKFHQREYRVQQHLLQQGLHLAVA